MTLTEADWVQLAKKLTNIDDTTTHGTHIPSADGDDDGEVLLAKRLAFHRADSKARQIVAAEEAERAATGDDSAATPEWRRVAISALRDKVLDREGLRNLPPSRYLIKTIFDFNSESWLIGASGSFKSFMAIDWACHIATGKPWWGHRIRKGKVFYIVAEGAKSFAKRIAAWEKVNNLEVDNLQILPVPVQARGNEFKDSVSQAWKVLCELTAEEKPALIVLDTQARMTVGLEENSNTAMGVWVEAVRMLREATGACVLVVHHTGRNGRDARGASALDGAQDFEWKVIRTGDKSKRLAKLACEKNKDDDDSIAFEFQAHVVELGEDEDGDPITSLILRRISPDLAEHLRGEGSSEAIEEFNGYDHDVRLTDNQAEVIGALFDVVDERGETVATINRIVNERRKEREAKIGRDFHPMPRSSLKRALESLEKAGCVIALGKTGSRFVHADKWGESEESEGGDASGEEGVDIDNAR